MIDYLVKIRKKTPLKKPTYWRKLSLHVGENYWLFQNWLRSLDWLKLTSRCLRLLRERTANSNNWTRKYEDVCLLWGDSKGVEEAFVSPGFKDWFIHVIFKVSRLATCISKHWRWFGYAAYSSRGNVSSFR